MGREELIEALHSYRRWSCDEGNGVILPGKRYLADLRAYYRMKRKLNKLFKNHYGEKLTEEEYQTLLWREKHNPLKMKKAGITIAPTAKNRWWKQVEEEVD